jgi:uncharacterized protein (DUF302 family)
LGTHVPAFTAAPLVGYSEGIARADRPRISSVRVKETPVPDVTEMQPFAKTVITERTFDQAVAVIEQKASEKGFRVLHTHDVAATLAEKGFPRSPLKIIEICNAKYASQVLSKDARISLMLPCPISVFVQDGKTHISTLLPSSISQFFPEAGIEQLAAEVEAIVLQIVDEAK